MFTHEPSYSLARTMDSLLFEFGMNARTPGHLAMREKDLPDLGNNESISRLRWQVGRLRHA